MCTLKLFDAADPDVILDERRLEDGPLAIGREPGPDGWTVIDPDRLISRAHCVFSAGAEGITVSDLSSNGVFRASDGQRLERGVETLVPFGEVLRLGGLCIRLDGRPERSPFAPPSGASPLGTVIRLGPLVQAAPAAPPAPTTNDFDALFTRPMLGRADPAETTAVVPTDWGEPPAVSSAPPVGAVLPDAALLEAFCAGARLDLSNFVGQDPREAMRSLGEVYRQMVLGLSDLMTERVTVKAEYRMSRTTIRSDNNNLFKWAGAQKVALDLLRPPADGFLRGPAAVNECFSDLKKHVLCVMAGLRATIAATLGELEPDKVQIGSGFLGVGRGGLESYRRLHAQVAATAAADPDGPVNRAFRKAYEDRLKELDQAAEAGFAARAS